MLVYDSHCHLDYITTLAIHDTPALIPAVNLTDTIALVKFRHDFPVYKIGFGIHPWYVEPNLNVSGLMLKLKQDIENFKPDCIGEIGLDYSKSNIELQQTLFIHQLELAQQYDLPVILHCVRAYNDLFRIVKQFKISCGIIHGFNANMIIARQFTNLGFLLGIGSLVCQNSKIKRCLPEINLDNLILESDAPFMPTAGHATSKSSDTFLYAQIVAKQYNMHLIDLINYSNTNFLRLFRN